jgi:hypothetical protein
MTPEDHVAVVLEERAEFVRRLLPLVRHGVGLARYPGWIAARRQGLSLAEWLALDLRSRERLLIRDRRAGGCWKICPLKRL